MSKEFTERKQGRKKILPQVLIAEKILSRLPSKFQSEREGEKLLQNFQKVYYDDDDGSFQSVLTHNIKKRNLALVTFNVHFSNGTKQSFRTILTYIHT